MAKCQYCRKKFQLPMDCKSCNKKLCISCYSPEIHKCCNYDIIIRKEKEKLNEKLLNQKCISNKIEKI